MKKLFLYIFSVFAFSPSLTFAAPLAAETSGFWSRFEGMNALTINPRYIFQQNLIQDP